MLPKKKILAASLIGIPLLLALALLLLSAISWNFARPWISERVSAATGRTFAIHGDLDMSWRRPEGSDLGWRRLVPWPHLRAHDLVLGNPDWATTGPVMLRVPQVDFSVATLPLFGKRIRVEKLILSAPDLVLELGSDGGNNWTFAPPAAADKASAWQLELRDLALNKGTVRLVDPVRKADVTTRIDTLEDGSVTWKIAGKVGEEAVSGEGKAGELLALRAQGQKYPVQAQLRVGHSRLSLEGTLTNPRSISALDAQLKVSGASMAHLFPFTGIVLPETPRFSTEGRLVGSLARDGFHLRYERFTGKLGSSDLAGTLEYLRKQPRPLLRGDVTSKRLNLDDLGVLVAGKEKKRRPGKVLPDGQFRTERWSKIDAEVRITAHSIVRGKSIPLDALSTRVRLDNGVLALSPLNFSVAGGQFIADVVIDGRKKPAHARVQVAAYGLKIQRLFPQVTAMRASLGEVHANAALAADGNSVAALAASADGELRAFVTQGTVSKFVLEAMGLNLGSVVLTQLFGDRQVQLNCLASDFALKEGIMQPRVFVVDTEDANIGVSGRIDLARETLALTVEPDSKGVRLISLSAPLHVRGTFSAPTVEVDKGAVALRAGAATVLGVAASPLAALLALINPGPAQDNPCGRLLAQARKPPQTPKK